MFSYYGSKSKIAKFYPPPEYKTIVEPFAGAAFYSIRHINNVERIVLNDKSGLIFGIWNFLINEATEKQILANRDFYIGQDIRNFDLCQAHRDLIGFCINRGSASPANVVQKWSCQVASRPDWASTAHYRLTQIAEYLPLFKRIEPLNLSYEELDNIEATWFIDPPYQFGGQRYMENKINYTHLAEWCKSRKGQIIVCENNKANWLRFYPLVTYRGQNYNSEECVAYFNNRTI